MIGHIEIRAEPPDGAATRALFREYLALIQDRLGLALQPTERVFAGERAFADGRGAWLVVYERGIAEIKRMVVSRRHRRSGHGRLLLRELERIAVERGHDRVRLLTTEVLSEARRLYAAEGYRVVQRIAREPVEIWLEKDVPDPRAVDYS